MKNLKCDYELDFNPPPKHMLDRICRRWPKFQRWLMLHDSRRVKKFLMWYDASWYLETSMYVILSDEITQEINREIIAEIEKAVKEQNP